MRIFLTGATGVIGIRVLPMLIEAGHQVSAVGRTDAKRAQLSQRGATPVSVDLFDREGLTRAIAGHDVVINLATAVPSPPMRGMLPGAWRDMDRIRREGSANLVHAARASGSVHTFIQESFAPIYESAGDSWITEDSAVRPARYNRSVLDAERNALSFTGDGRKGIVLRFALFYGPDDLATKQMLDGVRKGLFMMFGRGDDYFSYVHHDDAAAAVVAVLNADAGIYNVVEDEPMRRREAANGIAWLVGFHRPPRMPPPWGGKLLGSVGDMLSRSLRISNAKLRTTGWNARYQNIVAGLSPKVDA